MAMVQTLMTLRVCLLFPALMLAWVLSSAPAGAASTDGEKRVSISGAIAVVDSETSPTSLSLSINGTPASIEAGGNYLARIPASDVYQLRFEGAGAFTAVHTFAHAELEATTTGTISVPEIELVAKRPGRVELVFGGDVMMGRRYLEPRWNEPVLIRPETRADDMKRLIRHMTPYFKSADFAAVNLETILADKEPPVHAPKSVVFYTHPDILPALKAMGTDYVSLGNNHTYDYLDQGLQTTLEALDASGIGYSGAGFTERQALAPYRTNIGGQDYSMFGYVGWAGRVKPTQIAAPRKGGAAMGSTRNIVRSLRQEDAPGRVMLVQYHGSSEYSEGPTKITEKRLKAAVDAGADLVIGHHPHVAHGLELYNGKLIAWSLGNFMFDQFFYATHGAYALKVWMDGDSFYRAEIIPIQVKAYRPIPAMADVRRHVLQRVMHLSAKRGTRMHISGGHGVITASTDKASAQPDRITHVRQADGTIRKTAFSLNEALRRDAATKEKAIGRDLFFRGDFETYDLLGLKERSWETQNASLKIVETARTGRFALALTPADNRQPAKLGLKTFMRVLNQDRYTLSFWMKAETDFTVEAFVQSRPEGMNRYAALEEAKPRSIGTKKVTGGDWVQVNFDFEVGRAKNGRALPSRPILKFSPASSTSGKTPIVLDDLAVIGWQ